MPLNLNSITLTTPEILYGDSIEILSQMSSNSINAIITDPPYNIADSNKLSKVGNYIVSTQDAWGDSFDDSKAFEEYSQWLLMFAKEFYRVLTDDGSLLIFLDRKYTGYFVYLFEKEVHFIYKNKIYFEKRNPLPHFRKNNYRSCIEECLWFTKNTKFTFNYTNQQDLIQIYRGNIGKKATQHPTEKYTWMIAPLILKHTKVNDIILDPFLGSGTTGIVARQANRRFIGIEKNKEFFDMSKQRIQKLSVLF